MSGYKEFTTLLKDVMKYIQIFDEKERKIIWHNSSSECGFVVLKDGQYFSMPIYQAYSSIENIDDKFLYAKIELKKAVWDFPAARYALCHSIEKFASVGIKPLNFSNSASTYYGNLKDLLESIAYD